ncbi:alpha/beta hydrolase [Kibdelosporangium persicum]|uniref:Pimeloyl-ACP methyl ester carboxylesterase n=1 Tax=Kibdelosporangium persicum TaxID=2698649 RepID=A0ABX2FFW5_9PSEU|nr:alpha/beta hydrolase [Kibdelosporangium persicum]NRN70034.1 Pimeloyl-ACP methyl ester carboxylesterase [Kibdelosporangium persicum]
MHRPIARVATALTAAVVCTAAVPVAAAAASPFDGYKDQQLSWGSCLFTPAEGSLPAECALVTVPRDWANPGAGVDLRVSISRVKATGERTGVLLLNPGGPGGQGTSLAGDLAALQPAVVEKYDFIGMDPRGTGQEGGTQPEQLGLVCSVPTDRLSKRTDLDARDRSADSIAEHHKAPRAIAEACQSEALTPYITTWQTAHDMELIRQLLGESTLNYLGYSYGTWLGAKYTSLFPASAGKVVLDSSVDWQGRLQAAFEDFPVIGQRQFDQVFLPWMTRTFPEVVGSTPAEAKRTWERVRAYLKTQGLSGDSYDMVFVGMGSSLRWVLGALVFVLGASEIRGEAPPAARSADQQALLDAEAKAKFGVPMARLTAAKVAAAVAENDYTKVGGTRYAVACGDQPTRSATWYKALSNRQGPRYPLFGWAYGLSEPCGFWSDAPQQTLPVLPAAAAGKVLVVQGEFDPQTGYEQARSAIRAAPGVSIVSVDDSAFHGQYAMEGNPCVDGMVNVFLLRNSRPGNATCPGVPLPGETQVHPVSGPVKQTSAQATLAGLPRSALRAAVQDRIQSPR